MTVDTDYWERTTYLAILMERHPDKPVQQLLSTALRAYPLYSKEAQRHWLSWRKANRFRGPVDTAANICIKKLYSGIPI